MTFKQVTSLLYLVSLAFPQQTARPTLTVAAAANLTEVAKVLGTQFETETGIHAVFSFGSTAQLTQQIENGAPFDAFLERLGSEIRARALPDRKAAG